LAGGSCLFSSLLIRVSKLLGFLKVGVRQADIPLGFVSQAAIVVGDGKFRIEVDGFGGIRDGAVVVLLFIISYAAIVVGDGIFRIEVDGFGGIRDGAVVVLLIIIS
jgi:hypothetical protein